MEAVAFDIAPLLRSTPVHDRRISLGTCPCGRITAIRGPKPDGPESESSKIHDAASAGSFGLVSRRGRSGNTVRPFRHRSIACRVRARISWRQHRIPVWANSGARRSAPRLARRALDWSCVRYRLRAGLRKFERECGNCGRAQPRTDVADPHRSSSCWRQPANHGGGQCDVDSALEPRASGGAQSDGGRICVEQALSRLGALSSVVADTVAAKLELGWMAVLRGALSRQVSFFGRAQRGTMFPKEA